MRLLGGILLIIGTTIGAAMLALPVIGSLGGFFPSLVMFLIVWFFMTYTAFLLIEVNLEERQDTNIISMARRTLGIGGETFAWILYVLLLYCLAAAYISGSGALLDEALQDGFGLRVPAWVGPIPFVLIFGAIVYLGVESVDHLNRILMAALAVSYCVLAGMVAPHVQGHLFLRANWQYVLVPLSVVVTAFGFHIILPSLVAYLDHNPRRIKICLIAGSGIPLLIYTIWVFLILGIVPLRGLLAIGKSGQPAAGLIHVLQADIGAIGISGVAGFFSFFAIATSFLGVTLSLSDFLADGLKLHHLRRGKLLVTALTFIPPLLFAWLYPQGFIMALSFGGIIVALLLGLLPVAMTWSQRYIQKAVTPYRAPGGKVCLVLTALFFTAVVVLHFVRTGPESQALELIEEVQR